MAYLSTFDDWNLLLLLFTSQKYQSYFHTVLLVNLTSQILCYFLLRTHFSLANELTTLWVLIPYSVHVLKTIQPIPILMKQTYIHTNNKFSNESYFTVVLPHSIILTHDQVMWCDRMWCDVMSQYDPYKYYTNPSCPIQIMWYMWYTLLLLAAAATTAVPATTVIINAQTLYYHFPTNITPYILHFLTPTICNLYDTELHLSPSSYDYNPSPLRT